jgi:hypothetical protein
MRVKEKTNNKKLLSNKVSLASASRRRLIPLSGMATGE